MAGLNGVQIFVGDELIAGLNDLEYKHDGDWFTSEVEFEKDNLPPHNQYEFYLKRGNRFFFRNMWRSLWVEAEEMPKMKYGTKVFIDIN